MNSLKSCKAAHAAALFVGALAMHPVAQCHAADPQKVSGRAAMKAAPAPALQLDSLEVLRAELRAGKTSVIARTMRFPSEEQAAAFWPIYRQYQTDFAALNDRKLSLISDFLTKYDALDDESAKDLMKRTFEIQTETLKLRQNYAKTLSDKVSPMAAASFLQIEGVLQSLLDVEVKSSLPLIADRLNQQPLANQVAAEK
jgi:hypothetical protein